MKEARSAASRRLSVSSVYLQLMADAGRSAPHAPTHPVNHEFATERRLVERACTNSCTLCSLRKARSYASSGNASCNVRNVSNRHKPSLPRAAPVTPKSNDEQTEKTETERREKTERTEKRLAGPSAVRGGKVFIPEGIYAGKQLVWLEEHAGEIGDLHYKLKAEWFDSAFDLKVVAGRSKTPEAILIAFPGNRLLQWPLLNNNSSAVSDAFEALGGQWGRTGDVVTAEEERQKGDQKVSLVYGELHPDGVSKLLSRDSANAATAEHLVDLGAGKGRLVLQAFLTYPNLKLAVGIEFSESRFKCATECMANLARLNPLLFTYSYNRGAARLETRFGNRVMEMRLGDLFGYGSLSSADIVICQTDIPAQRRAELSTMLTKIKCGARLVLYHSLYTLPCTFPIIKTTPTYNHYSPAAHSPSDSPAVQVCSPLHAAVFSRPLATALFRTSWTPHFPIHIWQRTA